MNPTATPEVTRAPGRTTRPLHAQATGIQGGGPHMPTPAQAEGRGPGEETALRQTKSNSSLSSECKLPWLVHCFLPFTIISKYVTIISLVVQTLHPALSLSHQQLTASPPPDSSTQPRLQGRGLLKSCLSPQGTGFSASAQQGHGVLHSNRCHTLTPPQKHSSTQSSRPRHPVTTSTRT